MAVSKAKVGILISGRGSNMIALVERAKDSDSPYEVAIVMSDRPDAAGLDWARDAGLNVVEMPAPTPKHKSQFFQTLDDHLRAAGVECIALAGFMRIVPPSFVEKWRGKILNIHPSLLPKYKGLDTHARAIAAGDASGGCSVHIVTEELDGGPLVVQAVVPVESDDSAQTLAQRVHTQEHRIYPLAVRWFAEGRLILGEQGALLDGQLLAASGHLIRT